MFHSSAGFYITCSKKGVNVKVLKISYYRELSPAGTSLSHKAQGRRGRKGLKDDRSQLEKNCKLRFSRCDRMSHMRDCSHCIRRSQSDFQAGWVKDAEPQLWQRRCDSYRLLRESQSLSGEWPLVGCLWFSGWPRYHAHTESTGWTL